MSRQRSKATPSQFTCYRRLRVFGGPKADQVKRLEELRKTTSGLRSRAQGAYPAGSGCRSPWRFCRRSASSKPAVDNCSRRDGVGHQHPTLWPKSSVREYPLSRFQEAVASADPPLSSRLGSGGPEDRQCHGRRRFRHRQMPRCHGRL